MKICPALIGKAVAKVHQINEKSINWLYGNAQMQPIKHFLNSNLRLTVNVRVPCLQKKLFLY